MVSARWDPRASGPAVSSYILRVTGALDLTLPMTVRSISGTVPAGTYDLSVLASTRAARGSRRRRSRWSCRKPRSPASSCASSGRSLRQAP